MSRQLVIFNLANEYYGVDIGMVDSIIDMQSITHVPRAPEFVEGITNLRGVVLPIIDLRKRFGLEQTEFTKKSRIVVVQIEGLTVGMIVDAVTEVIHVPDDSIEALSPVVSTVDSVFITGVSKVDDRLIILLNLNQVLSAPEKTDLRDSLQLAEEDSL